MAWPNFSELTFAFAFLRELEARFGPYATLPNFISQADEATKGYDTEVALGGTILFIQFKRSEVMTSALAKEFQLGHFVSKPVYRMHLHRHHGYGQHKALQRLERTGNFVLYATSAAEDRSQLVAQAVRQTIATDSACFFPDEIVLPDTVQHHHVSFSAVSNSARIYSTEGEEFERRIFGKQSLAQHVGERRRNAKENRKLLKEFVRTHNTPRYREVVSKAEGIWHKAATLARLRYDLELVIPK